MNQVWYLLADAADSSTANTPGGMQTWLFYIVLAVLIVLLVLWFFLSGRKNKQRQKEYVEQLEAIAPGNKVKSIGGICGVVVEVCDDNTVVIETGTEASGKSFLKLDKECIAQTDAKGPTQTARENAEAKRKAEKEAKAAQEPQSPAAEDVPEAPEAPAPAEETETPAQQPGSEE